MTQENDSRRKIYVGTHDGVCALNTFDGGLTWEQGEMTPLANAAARLSASPVEPTCAYLAAYEAGVFKTEDGRRPFSAPTTEGRPGKSASAFKKFRRLTSGASTEIDSLTFASCEWRPGTRTPCLPASKLEE